VAAPAAGQQAALPVVVVPNFAKAFTPPGHPPCDKGIALEGNPRTGPSVVLVRFTAGCRIPWHWQTADMRIMMIRGEAMIEMQGRKPELLPAGAFAFFPSHYIRQFSCPTACEFFMSRTAPADIHYVGPDGQEISFEGAMAATKKPAAKKAAAKKAGAKPK